MADEQLRKLERAAAAGDPLAARRLRAERCRQGDHAWPDEWWRSLIHLTKWRICPGCGAREEGGEFPREELGELRIDGHRPGPGLLRHARRQYDDDDVSDLVKLDGCPSLFVKTEETDWS